MILVSICATFFILVLRSEKSKRIEMYGVKLFGMNLSDLYHKGLRKSGTQRQYLSSLTEGFFNPWTSITAVTGHTKTAPKISCADHNQP